MPNVLCAGLGGPVKSRRLAESWRRGKRKRETFFFLDEQENVRAVQSSGETRGQQLAMWWERDPERTLRICDDKQIADHASESTEVYSS